MFDSRGQVTYPGINIRGKHDPVVVSWFALHKFFEDGGTLSPERMHMMFTACYDLDKFREFVFESTLLQRFDVDEDFVEEIRQSDEALLRFAFLWLRFSLFGEKTMKMKTEAIDAVKGKQRKKKK